MAIRFADPAVGDLKLSDAVDTDDFARLCNVKPLSIHAYRKQITQARRKVEIAVERYGSKSRQARTARAALARAREHPFPEPVAYVGSTPIWTRDQAVGWITGRPGRGTRSDLPLAS